MSIKEFLHEYGFRFKKKWGQNFITDRGTLEKIAELAEVGPEDVIVEVGAGMGTLTTVLAERAKLVIAIEIDKDLFPYLRKILDEEKVVLVQGDALEMDLDRLVAEHSGNPSQSYKIVSNLPYYIVTPLLFNFLEEEKNVERIVVMMQKEVAERLAAEPGTKDYGSLTVSTKLHADVGKVIYISRKVFIPQPEVDSAVVDMRIKTEKLAVNDDKLLQKIVRAAFGQRRKTLQNALKCLGEDKEFLEKLLQNSEIDGQRRGETLTPEEFIRMADEFGELKKESGSAGVKP